jgi:hypothetical protein
MTNKIYLVVHHNSSTKIRKNKMFDFLKDKTVEQQAQELVRWNNSFFEKLLSLYNNIEDLGILCLV